MFDISGLLGKTADIRKVTGNSLETGVISGGYLNPKGQLVLLVVSNGNGDIHECLTNQIQIDLPDKPWSDTHVQNPSGEPEAW